MDLKTRFTTDMKEAMKAQDTAKVSVLRMLIAEIKKREIDKRAPLDDAEILKTIGSMVKQRQDAVEAFTKGGREDLAAGERAEIALLQSYLPKQLDRAAIEAIVVAAIAEVGASSPNDLGKVMKAVLPKVTGQADGKLVNEIVRSKLSGA
jgi:uncharacterized protein YqeY